MRLYHLFIFSILWVGCADAPEYSPVPTLRFESISKDEMIQGRAMEDSLIIKLFFTDGDGDFGTATQSSESNIFIIDKRTNEIKDLFKAPEIPQQGANNGVSGTISIKVFNTCCVFPAATGIPPCERTTLFPENDLILEIYIKDRAGNVSNTVNTEIIRLKCI